MSTSTMEEMLTEGGPVGPVLSTRGLVLVPAHEFVEDYSRWLNDPEVVQFSELRHRQHSWDECREYIKSHDFHDRYMWFMSAVGANMHIGNITLHIDRPNGVGQMGILIGEKWAWGRKYGLEAWKVVMEFAKTINLRRLEAGCMSDNIGMRKIMDRSSMPKVADVNYHFMRDGRPAALVLYGVNL